jgi:hypothetical protein
MTEQIIGAESANPAAGNGTLGTSHRDTSAASGLPPSVCPNRSPKIGYVDRHGSGQEAGSVHIDHCPVGVMNVEGAWILACWCHSCAVELAGA